jgi:signal transduction histidine kinase
MSHELRTPINAVLGYSESLLEGIYDPLSERQYSAVNSITFSGKHLLTVINDILDLEKLRPAT